MKSNQNLQSRQYFEANKEQIESEICKLFDIHGVTNFVVFLEGNNILLQMGNVKEKTVIEAISNAVQNSFNH